MRFPQARILEWVVIPLSRGSFWPRDWTWVSCIAGRFFPIWTIKEASKTRLSEWVKSLSRVRLFVTPWTVVCQVSPSMGFSRQEYWNGLPFPSPGDLPDPGIKPGSPTLEADALTSEPTQLPVFCSFFNILNTFKSVIPCKSPSMIWNISRVEEKYIWAYLNLKIWDYLTFLGNEIISSLILAYMATGEKVYEAEKNQRVRSEKL